MPAYSFQKQFVPPIESRRKGHTIRGKRKHRPKVGQTIYLYYAMRTKQCRLVAQSVITAVQDIIIDPTEREISVDGVLLDLHAKNSLARSDGFRSVWDMLNWWRVTHGDGIFEGDLIHWLNPDKYHPHTTSDICWCQPFAFSKRLQKEPWRKHPRCPMHKTVRSRGEPTDVPA